MPARFAILAPTTCVTLTCSECGALLFVSVGASDLRSFRNEIDAELKKHNCAKLTDRNGRPVSITKETQ